MARQIVVLALVLIALVGLVSAEKTTDAEPSPASLGDFEAAAAAALDDEAIGNTDVDSIGNTDEAAAGAPSKSTDGGDAGVAGVAAVEGPIGSEEAAKSFAGAAQPASSGATTLGVSAVAVAAAIAGYFVF